MRYYKHLYLTEGLEKKKEKIIRKLEAGNRDIFREYTAYCRYKGKPVRSIERRRKMEFLLLYEP